MEITLLALVLVTAYLVGRWCRNQGHKPGGVHVALSRWAHVVDSGHDYSKGDGEIVSESSGRIKFHACQWRAVMAVRAKVGLMTENAANRLVAGRLIREAMVEDGMRPSHIARMAPVALELYFIPYETDKVASLVRNSQFKRDATREVTFDVK